MSKTLQHVWGQLCIVEEALVSGTDGTIHCAQGDADATIAK